MSIADKIKNDLISHKKFYNNTPRHIFIDKEIHLLLCKEFDNNLPEIFGMKIIIVTDLHSPNGKVKWILDGTKYR